ncbi:uncharacterized protein TM35_000272080 [Trypanosoma theileri]|uniref:Uncharacterized protein n=1 Tax=Trypanosoma theileri TaxID=67003 RepID=A0A1X0NQ30_9TRYP|nr:uncharacterized protein TM35_000272080 [Trypanosoma theileri]ORC86618.1 hypothetical protein TM35_000272080 [Trypanosoma theileri]
MRAKRGRPRKVKGDEAVKKSVDGDNDESPLFPPLSLTSSKDEVPQRGQLTLTSFVSSTSSSRISPRASPPRSTRKMEEEQKQQQQQSNHPKEEFLFDKSVRDAMKPSVTRQFKMSWCWPASPLHKVEMISDNCCRNVGLTSIVELRGDPHLERGERLVVLILSCGQRFLLPLIPEPRDSTKVQETGIFWRVPMRSYQDQVPPFAELVIGTVQELEKAANIIVNSSETVGLSKMMNENKKKELERQLPIDSLSNLSTFFFQSLPYRTLWLYQFRKSLIISLPCEERLVSLSLEPSGQKTRISPSLMTNVIKRTASFRLPSSVVPLDLSEVFDRPFLAVGTVSHGVLIILLEGLGTCACIVNRIALSGLSTSMFPVTRICTLFPPLSSEEKKSTTLGVWEKKSTVVSQSLDGTILCSSPYENRTVVVKCASTGADGSGFESPPPTRTVASFLCSAPYCDSTLAPLIATQDGKVIQFGTDATMTTNSKDDVPASTENKRRQHYGKFDAVHPEIVYDNTVRPLLSSPPNHFCEGGPVPQAVSNSTYQPTYTRHWLCITTIGMEVLLLDRKLINYIKHSTITLSIPSFSNKQTPNEQCYNERLEKKGENENENSSVKSNTQTTPADDATYRTALEDGATGISWLKVEDGLLQAIVTHHQCFLTIVTWKP